MFRKEVKNSKSKGLCQCSEINAVKLQMYIKHYSTHINLVTCKNICIPYHPEFVTKKGVNLEFCNCYCLIIISILKYDILGFNAMLWQVNVLYVSLTSIVEVSSYHKINRLESKLLTTNFYWHRKKTCIN
jgi:hypothetical protein